MNRHEQLDSTLRKLLKVGYPSRPFVCSGSPFECEVAVVGANPSSSTCFWPYWDAASGFDRDGWRKAYAKDPANDAKLSRHAIDALVAALLPTRTIELNAYPYIERQYKDLRSTLKDTGVLEYMLSAIAPRVVYSSGHVASNVVAKLLAVDRRKPGFQSGGTSKLSCRILLDDQHFMEWAPSDVSKRANELSERIRSQL